MPSAILRVPPFEQLTARPCASRAPSEARPATGALAAAVDAAMPCPRDTVTCRSVAADGACWLGTDRGAWRLRTGRWRYFAGRRWLPDDRVLHIDASPNGGAVITTAGGTVCIEGRMCSLMDKATHFENVTAERHDRRGYVAECVLDRPGDVTSWRPVVTDNDGLWTALYVVSQAMRWAVTHDDEARYRARRAMEALLHLLDVTGLPGFMARAVVWDGEDCDGVDSDDPNWRRRDPRDPRCRWKGDTSSDEVDGHYLAWYVYHALVADAAERQRIEQACRAVTRGLIDHGLYLVGPDGAPTTWGVWAPEKLNGDPKWRDERGLNSLEILSHLRVAHALCGDAEFEAAYGTLVRDHGYALNTLTQKVIPPDGPNNHSDDELAWAAYYPLLVLERDPELREVYLRSLRRTQRALRPEGSPLHNFLYGVATRDWSDVAAGAAWLCEAPLDLVEWDMTNRHRTDVARADRPGRFGEAQSRDVLPLGERALHKWNGNPYALDGGNGGKTEVDATFWTLPYWFGRYHGIIEEA